MQETICIVNKQMLTKLQYEEPITDPSHASAPVFTIIITPVLAGPQRLGTVTSCVRRIGTSIVTPTASSTQYVVSMQPGRLVFHHSWVGKMRTSYVWIKLWHPLTMRAIPQHLLGEVLSERGLHFYLHRYLHVLYMYLKWCNLRNVSWRKAWKRLQESVRTANTLNAGRKLGITWPLS